MKLKTLELKIEELTKDLNCEVGAVTKKHDNLQSNMMHCASQVQQQIQSMLSVVLFYRDFLLPSELKKNIADTVGDIQVSLSKTAKIIQEPSPV